MRGHEEASGTAYVPPALFEEWARKDPLARFEQRARRARRAAGEPIARALRADLEAHRRARGRALAAPEPRSTAERELADVYAPALGRAPRAGAAALRRRRPSVRYVDAISDGLREAMRRDARSS